MTGRARAALLGLVLAGCEARELVVGEGQPSVSAEGPGGFAPPRCAAAAVERVDDQQCWPTRHVGLWRGFVTGDVRYWHVLDTPLLLPSGEVLLEIEPQGTGTLRFEADAVGAGCSADAGAPPPLGADGAASAGLEGEPAGGGGCGSSSAPDEPRLGLLLGFRYALAGLSMSGGPEEDRTLDPRVEFSLLIAEPWRERCASSAPQLAPSPCVCAEQGCGPSTDSLLGALSLSRDGQALRGTLLSPGEAPLTADLELVRQ